MSGIVELNNRNISVVFGGKSNDSYRLCVIKSRGLVFNLKKAHAPREEIRAAQRGYYIRCLDDYNMDEAKGIEYFDAWEK